MKKSVKMEEEKNLDGRESKAFFNQLSGVKSAWLVGSCNKEGQSNLAIFSSLVHLGANPPLMGLVSRPHTVEKHTIENIQEMGKFSLNLIPYKMVREAHLTSARFTREISEFSACGFSEVPCQGIPTVKESPLSIILDLKRILDIEENGTHFIIGQVSEVLMEGDDLNFQDYDPLLCVGLDQYHRLNNEGPPLKLKYAKPDMTIKDL